MIQGTEESQPQEDRIQKARITLDFMIDLSHKIIEIFQEITHYHGQYMEFTYVINQEAVTNPQNHLQEKKDQEKT